MKIWAYSDVHIGTQATLRELAIAPDYRYGFRFLTLVRDENPDFIVCIGDCAETLWDGRRLLDGLYDGLLRQLRGITHRFLAGNHDPDAGEQVLALDHLQFLHGHQWEKASEGYVERLHAKANRGHPVFNVVGHTHSPAIGENFMDVGSLTLTGTFGEIDASGRRLRIIPAIGGENVAGSDRCYRRSEGPPAGKRQ